MYDIGILAGGFGTRLQSVIGDLPKPLADIDGTPFLIRQLQHITKFECETVYLSLHYRADLIIEVVSKFSFPFNIEFVVEEEPLGTGGAIKYLFEVADKESLLVLNGDTFTDVDLDKLHEYGRQTQSDVVIAACFMEWADRYGVLELQGDRLVGFSNSQEMSGCFINSGCYYISRHVLDDQPLSSFSFEQEVLPTTRENSVRVLKYEGPFIDIGVPSDYEKAAEVMCSAK